MAEQRVNGLGQTVEFNEKSGRWDKVVDKVEKTEEPREDPTPTSTEVQGTGDPAPGEDETLAEEGDATPRRKFF